MEIHCRGKNKGGEEEMVISCPHSQSALSVDYCLGVMNQYVGILQGELSVYSPNIKLLEGTLFYTL